ncbi:hypothetical protein DFP72DRAFT_916037 [Ephemerocybe angulata]|uniref:F-box domain-containing protein n=1 Tax=Ephemerocybe angulata TaxID=980116 RepID=A0A8H6LY79_9AGAR|nr:hypothetical protein DFP72DRAFT_916037 [Tulosesus angulatus]
MRSGYDTLPPEILGEVFCFSLLHTVVLDEQSQLHLLTICLVCKAWRDAAHLNHHLWRGIGQLRIQSRGALFSHRKAISWLSRSGSLRKSVGITLSCPLQGWAGCEENQCTGSNAGLAKFLHRVSPMEHLSLEFSGTSECYFNLCASMKRESDRSATALRSLDTGTLPLTSLALSFNNTFALQLGASQSGCLFNTLPPITSLELRLSSLPFGVANPFVEELQTHKIFSRSILRALTSFTIRCDWPLNQLARLLEPCVNIEELTLFIGHSAYFQDPATTESVRRIGVQLPKMRTLRLRHLLPSAMRLLEILPVNRVTNLDLSFPGSGLWETQQNVRSCSPFWAAFIRRNADTLRFIRLHDVKISSVILLEMLPSHLISLETLILDRVNFNSDVFRHWTLPPIDVEEGAKWFPKLKTIKILQAFPTFDPEAVFSFLTARRPFHAEPEEGNAISFGEPSDGIKQLVITYQLPIGQGNLVLQAADEEVESICSALRRGGMLVHVGPRYLREFRRRQIPLGAHLTFPSKAN